ncbi:MAG: HD domain-containing protein [Clostridiales bacterium]|nr:HD domain-containing protein [Clostridiales bacterium]
MEEIQVRAAAAEEPGIFIPAGAAEVLERLQKGGHEAYVVGGCVRDSLLGRQPLDWDITTSARPEETAACFAGERIVETGLRHGTITLLLRGQPYEITTYRLDGAYADCRRPRQVTFTRSLSEDLARRDFTIGAMAYRPGEGLVDLYGGREDLSRRIVRCVGKPDKRFGEDALRILRALRFASVLDFRLDADTAQAAYSCRGLLHKIAPERIRVELDRLLCGPAAGRVLREYRMILAELLPEILPLHGFCQHTPYHVYDVWEHTLRTVEAVEARPALRLTMLLHDMGKPACFVMDDKGQGHFHGHPAKSAELARGILERLRYDNRTARTVLELIRLHDHRLEPVPSVIRRLLADIGPERLTQLIRVQRADAAGKADAAREEQTRRVNETEILLEEILRRGDCYTLRDLAVSGQDILSLGVPAGPEVGRLLQMLLRSVIAGEAANTREALLEKARRMVGQK